MSYKRSLAVFVACSLTLIAPSLFAGQVNGQLGVSITIAKHCEVSGERDGRGLNMGWSGCKDAAFQLHDEQGRQLPALRNEQTASIRVEPAELSAERVVVYW